MVAACAGFYVVALVFFIFTIVILSSLACAREDTKYIAAIVILAFTCGIFFGWAVWLTVKALEV